MKYKVRSGEMKLVIDKMELENFIRNKLQELEEMQDYEVPTDTVRAWIDIWHEQEVNPQPEDGASPDNVEIWKWWQTQNFQKEQGEQEYTMIYEIDLPKILKAFVERFTNCG